MTTATKHAQTTKILSIEKLDFSYTEDPLIRDLDFAIHTGELALIIGENGSGKSTLLKLILGELSPKAGQITVLGQPLETIKDFHAIGYVPQVHSVNTIAFPITCLEMVVLNLNKQFGWLKIPRRKHKARAIASLKKMGLDAYIHTPFKELSGGLQQRVMIARAMIHEPQLLILDEPTAGVDQESKLQFMELLKQLNQEEGISIILVSHELSFLQEELQLDSYYHMDQGGLNLVTI